jgi:alkylation response protein AidB-like acyl-CoA dehydrogenase
LRFSSRRFGVDEERNWKGEQSKMDFELTEEQKMFRQMAREFAERELISAGKEYDQSGKYPHEFFKKMAPLGLLGILIPQQYGGLGLGPLTWVLINEQLAWGSMSIATITQTGMLPGSIILDAGNEEQKKKYLPPLCCGEKIYSMAAAEPNAGSDGANIETKAVLDGDSWVLNGNKVFVTNGNMADMIIVLAQTEKGKGGKGLVLVAVEKETPGLFRAPIKGETGLRCGDIAQVRLTDCRVPRENAINEVGLGLKFAFGGITNMRICISSQCVGLAQRCIDICVKYAKERQQFKKPIGSFQLVQELIAESVVETEAARWLTYHAAYRREKGLSVTREASIAKLFSTEMAVRTTVRAIKVHGGYGCFEDYTVERLNREALITLAPGGTSEVHKMTIGRQMLDIDALSR